MTKPQTYSLQEVADLLGVTATTVARRADAGEVPVIAIGRRRLVPRAYIHGLFVQAGFPLRREEQECPSMTTQPNPNG